MPVKVVKRDGRYRVVESATGTLAKHRAGKAADGGGHRDRAKAERQAAAINAGMAKKAK